ncbi:putative ATP-dependent RNA helicase DDX20 [Amia ocellicauda]|uniref:putative ATP-dependent RNA helicase DDX20 n=1 Tax=Amia ocellicauda TaxID=2972642 RepID=UPI003463BFEA
MASPMKKAAHDIETRRRTDDVLLSEGLDFSSLLLSQPVLEGLTASGFQKPSPIQLKAIPLGRCGLDLIVQAKSGTGKTCVFSTIALDSLLADNPATQVLVLAPTREIAVQIHSVITAIGIMIEGLQCHVFIGGTPVSLDKTRLKKCHIAVGSPGRIKQLIEMGYLSTASIRLFVLDEADKLLEEGSFQDQINWIYSSLPVNKQMLALSATYPESLAQHLARYMRDPTFIRLNPSDPGLIGLKQYYKVVRSHPMPHKIFEEKVHHLFELFGKIPFNQALVFSNLHSRAQHLADILTSKGLPAVCISGSLSQDQRLQAMSKLKQYQCRVLISTDLTSRGIDAEKVNLVINLDIPQDWETYMHRIGRAGRFGTHGLAVTYCCHGEEENKIMSIAHKCSLSLLCLPDPIPPGLMEEPSDWAVTVESIKTDPDLGGAIEAENTGGLISPPGADTSPAKSRVLKKPPKRAAKQPPLDQGAAQEAVKSVSVSIRKETPETRLPRAKPGPQVLKTVAPQGLERKALQDALPKIPPLPSFKARPPHPMSFEELVADYDCFITDGPGRSVEIIRQFTGPDNGQWTEEMQDPEIPPNAGSREVVDDHRAPERAVSTSPSRLASHGSSSSSDVSSDRNADTDTGAGADTDGELSSEQGGDVWAPPSRPSRLSRENLRLLEPVGPMRHPAQPAALPTPEPAAALKHHAPASPHFERPKKKETKRVSSQEPRAIPDCEGPPDETPRDVPPTPVSKSHQEYWQAYYQAWQGYYAAMAPPSNPMAYSWMAAYRMNAVYMEELLKR